MDGQIKTFGQAVTLAMAAVPSPEQSTKASTSSTEAAHKRKFFETFRRWEMLFKRKDSGDVQAEKWLIAEYYQSLRHLSAEGLDALTMQLKETCIFFPTIRECLEATRPASSFDYAHPFFKKPHLFQAPAPRALQAPRAAISDQSAV